MLATSAAATVWIPHSTLSRPAHRPERPAPGSVEWMSPIDSYPRSCSGLYGSSRARMYSQHISSVQLASGFAFQSSCCSSQPSFGASARVGDWSRRIPVTQASRPASAVTSGATLAIAR